MTVDVQTSEDDVDLEQFDATASVNKMDGQPLGAMLFIGGKALPDGVEEIDYRVMGDTIELNFRY